MPTSRAPRAALVDVLKRMRGDVALRREARHLERALRRDLRRDLRLEIRRLEETLQDDLHRVDQRLVELQGDKPSGPFAQAKDEIRALFDDPRPWMVDEAVDFASKQLTSDMVGLEWGGGASTPYWCRRLGVLHTVEASPGWGLLLLDYMTQQLDLIDHWRLHFVGANWASTGSKRRRTGRSMPSPDVRRLLEADYAILLSEPVDALFLDGAVRQLTARRMADYIARDEPSVIVIDNTDKSYVIDAVDESALHAYHRHDFWGEQSTNDGRGTEPHCTSVWLRQ